MTCASLRLGNSWHVLKVVYLGNKLKMLLNILGLSTNFISLLRIFLNKVYKAFIMEHSKETLPRFKSSHLSSKSVVGLKLLSTLSVFSERNDIFAQGEEFTGMQ